MKHSQFLLNHFHTQVVTLPTLRWKKDYQGPLCEFGRAVLFRMPGKLRNITDTSWHTGIWPGKDTEADESIAQYEGIVHKVSTVERVVPSKKWNTALHNLLKSTPWDPKGEDTTDTSFVLPPAMIASGRVRPPPGLDTEAFEEHTEAMKSEEPTTDKVDEESLRPLEQQHTDVRLPQLERVASSKRSNGDKLSDDDTRENKRQTAALI